MDWLILPALTAICFKIVILMRYHESLRKENLNLGIFFIAAFLLNLVELLVLDMTYSYSTAMLLLLIYYCSVVFMIHGYLNIALSYSQFSWNLPKIKLSLNFLLAILTVGLIFNRTIIADVDTSGIAPTKIPGTNYWFFQIYALGGMVAASALLIRGFRKSDSNLLRQRNLVVLLAVTPVVMVAIGVIIFQQLGYENTTAAVSVSCALTLMLAILVYAEEKTRLFRLLTIVPFTKERKLHKKLLDQITDCVSINENPCRQNSLQLKQMMKDLEGTVVEHVLDYYGGNQKLTASALGVSEATVSRRARAATMNSREQLDTTAYSTDSIRITP